MVLRTVEETLNALLDEEADRLCGAKKYSRLQWKFFSKSVKVVHTD